jgi:hypothetical protein
VREMFVDPGLNTATSVWQDENLVNTHLDQVQAGIDHEEQMTVLFCRFRPLLQTVVPSFVQIEGVQRFGGLTSETASLRGNLALLAEIVGGYCALCFVEGIEFEIILPTEWKGQMNKRILGARVKRAMGKVFPNHVADAVGMGLKKYGRL